MWWVNEYILVEVVVPLHFVSSSHSFIAIPTTYILAKYKYFRTGSSAELVFLQIGNSVLNKFPQVLKYVLLKLVWLKVIFFLQTDYPSCPIHGDAWWPNVLNIFNSRYYNTERKFRIDIEPDIRRGTVFSKRWKFIGPNVVFRDHNIKEWPIYDAQGV